MKEKVFQGGVYWVDFDPVKGHEQGERRPALVVSNQVYNNLSGGLAIIVPVSSTASTFPLHLQLPTSMQSHGAVLCQHIRTVDTEARNFEFIEQVPEEFLSQILNTIDMLFN